MRVGSVWSNFDQHPTVLGLHHHLEVILKLRLYWNVQWSRYRVTVLDIHQCVWSRSAHTSQVDVQLNFTMRLISGTLRSTPLPLLPVLSNIEPPTLRRKAATDKLVEKIVKHDSWPIQPDILSPPLL